MNSFPGQLLVSRQKQIGCVRHMCKVTGYNWGLFRAPNAITRSAQLHHTRATKDAAQIERHLMRTHSCMGTVSHGLKTFEPKCDQLSNRERQAMVQTVFLFLFLLLLLLLLLLLFLLFLLVTRSLQIHRY